VRVVTPAKLLYVSFEFNLEKDTPEGVVEEMRHDLELNDPKQIKALKIQIQNTIAKVLS